MRVGKRPVEAIKDGNEGCCRTGRHEIGKIGGNGHDTLLSRGCVSTNYKSASHLSIANDLISSRDAVM